MRLSGTIGRVSRFQSGLTLASVAPLLKKAFAIKAAPAVALVINSPGGSPVQSHLIYKRIRALAEEKEKPVIVFVEDVCASGGYMIACAGDEIVVDPASIVGSIGVVTAGFGFVELMRKVGVERRVYTSGESKVILDPFQPEKPDDVARLKAIQEEVHDHFIEIVRTRRGDVLAKDRDERHFFRPVLVGKDGGLARPRRPHRRPPRGAARKIRRKGAAEAVFHRAELLRPSAASGSAARSARRLPRRLIAELDERALWERYRL